MLIALVLACVPAPDLPKEGEVEPLDPLAVSDFVADGDDYVATHGPMGLVSRVTPERLVVSGEGWVFSMRPQAWGREVLAPIQPQRPEWDGGRVLAASNPTLWYTHDARGLEFGFDIAERPAGEGPLRIRMAVDAPAPWWSTGTDLSFMVGRTRVRIDGLVVRGADGELVPSVLRLDCGDTEEDPNAGACALAIDVDDGEASYPLVVDPLLDASPASSGVGVPISSLAPGDLLITELMIDPSPVDDNRGEYIEITNLRPDAVRLDGLAVWDDGTNYFQIPENGFDVPAGGRFVLAASANLANNGGVVAQIAFPHTNNGLQLGNVGDEVVIGRRESASACSVANPCEEIDRVEYDSSWFQTLPGAGAAQIASGASLSLDPTRFDATQNDARGSWCDGLAPFGTGQFGTPGAPNESCAFTLPFEYEWALTNGTTLSRCTDVRVRVDGTMTTGNGGDGTWFRHTVAGFQTLRWSYASPAGVVYSGVRGPGTTTWSGGFMPEFDPSIALGGSWISPCRSDTADTGAPPPPPVRPLLFTQYLEGSAGVHKFVEIKNTASVNTSLAGCELRLYYNGSTTAGNTLDLGPLGPLGPGALLSVCNSNAPGGSVPPGRPCDQDWAFLNFNGDDAVQLICDVTPIDVIGQIGFDPGSSWGTAPLGTANSNLFRRCDIAVGDPNGSDAFDPADEWIAGTPDDASNIGLPNPCP